MLVRMQPEKPPPGVYPAVQLDAGIIWEIGCLAMPPSADSRPGCSQRTVCIITGIVDLPVSLLADTFCLPWDLRRLWRSIGGKHE
jgi:uncharacterized protein YceK